MIKIKYTDYEPTCTEGRRVDLSPPLSKAIDVGKVLGRCRPWRRRRKQLLSFGPLSDGQELRRLDSNFGK